ncbi:MAG: alkaline phosphatase family protein [Chitinophagales bacterium]|nr:alkaline phosphatase family protein [Chitinophagales bacterium]
MFFFQKNLKKLPFFTIFRVLWLFTFVCIAVPTMVAQNNLPPLVAGPMLGYTEHREALIWLEVSPSVKTVEVQYWKKGQTQTRQKLRYRGKLQQEFNPIKFVLTALDMGTTYEYAIFVDKKRQKANQNLSFQTKKLWEWREPAPNFSFLMGSCHYTNDEPYDRPGKPYGEDSSIFGQMVQQPSDFMLWLGDNVYLREADYSSRYGIQYRYQHTRRQEVLQNFLASRPQYMIWDDHDYGPNDSNSSYELKEQALQTFIDYSGNESYGTPNDKGIYSRFQWSDSEFFLLDNRYHRDPETLQDSNKTYLGKKQLAWLKNSLLSSKATFKFIASGSQVLNKANKFECYANYTQELDELLAFIERHQIKGVVFLSGDRHFSEIITQQRNNAYTLLDITSSPITSHTFDKVAESNEGKNPQRMDGTLLAENSYMKLSVSGEKGKRVLTVQAFDRNNQEKWRKSFAETEFR